MGSVLAKTTCNPIIISSPFQRVKGTPPKYVSRLTLASIIRNPTNSPITSVLIHTPQDLLRKSIPIEQLGEYSVPVLTYVRFTLGIVVTININERKLEQSIGGSQRRRGRSLKATFFEAASSESNCLFRSFGDAVSKNVPFKDRPCLRCKPRLSVHGYGISCADQNALQYRSAHYVQMGKSTLQILTFRLFLK